MEGEGREEAEETVLHDLTPLTSVPSKSDLRAATNLMRRDRMTAALQEAMKVPLGTLYECQMKAFVVKAIELVELKRIPLLESYFYRICQRKDMSAVLDSAAVRDTALGV